YLTHGLFFSVILKWMTSCSGREQKELRHKVIEMDHSTVREQYRHVVFDDHAVVQGRHPFYVLTLPYLKVLRHVYQYLLLVWLLPVERMRCFRQLFFG